MKRIHALIIFAIAIPAFASPDNGPDEPEKDGPLAGVYHVIGSEDGKAYYSVMTVIHKDGSDAIKTVQVNNTSVAYGVGIVKGDTIALAWRQGASFGVTHYTLSKDKKTWDGIWTEGVEKPRTEKATFLRRINGTEL